MFEDVCVSQLTSLILIGLSHIRVSTHVSTAYRDTKGTSHVRRRYVGIRSSYSSIRILEYAKLVGLRSQRQLAQSSEKKQSNFLPYQE